MGETRNRKIRGEERGAEAQPAADLHHAQGGGGKKEEEGKHIFGLKQRGGPSTLVS